MRWLAFGALILAAGCARQPAAGTLPTTTRLVFKLTMAREVNDNFVYIVALRPSRDLNPTEQGPIPVIAPPWGNGFVAGTVTHYIRYSLDQSPRYQIYTFRDGNLLDFRPIAAPVNAIEPPPGGRNLEFEIDLSQISASVQEAQEWQSIQVNLLTMDRVPQGSGGSKNWDALGDGRLPSEINSPVTLPLRTAGVYDNIRFLGLEPTGDQIDPDLDLVDFRIEVRPQR